jgi:hypothetical protein
MILLSWGAPLMPAGGSCCNLLKSLISLFLAGVDIFTTVLELSFGLEIPSLFLATLNLNPLFHLILGVLMMLVKLLELRDEGWKKKFRVWVKI